MEWETIRNSLLHVGVSASVEELMDVVAESDLNDFHDELKSVQQVIRLLLLHSMLDVGAQKDEQRTPCEAIITSARRGLHTQKGTDGIWLAHLNIQDMRLVSSPNLDIYSPKYGKIVQLFNDEPPRCAHTCGQLFTSRTEFRDSKRLHVMDIRKIFRNEIWALKFADLAMPYLSESSIITKEIDVPSRLNRVPNLRVFCITPEMALDMATRSHGLCFVWVCANVIAKTVVVSPSPFKEPAIQRLINRASDRLQTFCNEFPMDFNPSSMPHVLQCYYSRVVSARLELFKQGLSSSLLGLDRRLETMAPFDVRVSMLAATQAIEQASCHTTPCLECGKVLSRASFSQRRWKKYKAEPSKLPTCRNCAAEDGRTPNADATAKREVKKTLDEIIEELLVMGYHQSLVNFMIKAAGDDVGVDDMDHLLREKYRTEQYCPICFFDFCTERPLVLRPCCRQALCLSCDVACQGLHQGCAFCRQHAELDISQSEDVAQVSERSRRGRRRHRR